MLYQLHEFNHAAIAPMRMVAQTMGAVLSNPFLPVSYTNTARTIAASAAVFERLTRHYPKPDFGLPTTTVDGREVAVTEEISLSLPFCDLIHFKREGVPEGTHPKMLLVAPLSGHYATLLRGTVEGLLHEHDVYITDWRNARDVPLNEGPFGLDDYVEYVRRCLTHIGPDTHVMAVCQPSVPVLAAVSLMAEDKDPCRPRTMTLMGGPIDTRKSPTEVNQYALAHDLEWFERRVVHSVPFGYPAAGRLVYPGFLQLTGFMSMNMDRHVDAHVNYYRHLVRGDGDSAEQHRKFYDEYLSVMDLPAEFYIDTVGAVFQDHLLPRGLMTVHDRKVDPSAISDIGVLTVEGEKDDITGLGQTEATHDLCPNLPDSMKMHYVQPKVGHYGIFNGRRWREEILPRVTEFVRRHHTAAAGRRSIAA